MLKDKKYILLVLFLLTISLFIGCKSNDKTDKNNTKNKETIEDIPVEGGKVILPLTNFKTLNPLKINNFYYYQFSKLIYEGLFEFNEELKPVPKLAESYDILNGGRTVSIKIRDGVKWHDGQSLSTEDIGFTIDVIKNAGDTSIYNKIFRDNLDIVQTNPNNVINYRIVNNSTIEIDYDKAYSNSLEALTFPIIPKHIFSTGNESSIYNNALEEDNYKPIGTGPYKFINYEKYKNIELKRNEDYWNGKPYIEEIIGKVFDEEELILTAYETGQINLAATIGVDWDKYKQNKRIKIVEYTSPIYEAIGFNFNNPIFHDEKGIKIRQAINYGIDRQDIIERVFLGHGVQVDVPIHPDSYLISEKGYTYGYDLEKSKKLLKEAGYTETVGDGLLRNEEGNTLSLRFLANSNNIQRLRTGELIVEYLSELGIDVQAEFIGEYDDEIDEIVEDEQWLAFNQRVQSRDFDIVLLGWETSAATNLGDLFYSGNIGVGSNFISYSNEDTDNLLVESYFSSNIEDKIGKYEGLQEDIVKKLPYVSLLFRNRGLLIDNKIKGELNPNYYNIYKGLEKSYIPKDLQ